MDHDRPDLLSTLIAASGRLLRRNPALWAAGFLGGVLAALLLSRYASALSPTDGRQAVLALGLVGLSFGLGWLLREAARQRRGLRRQQIPVRHDADEE